MCVKVTHIVRTKKLSYFGRYNVEVSSDNSGLVILTKNIHTFHVCYLVGSLVLQIQRSS